MISDLSPPEGKSDQFDFQRADVTKWADLVKLMEVAKEKYGAIDMVCANVSYGNEVGIRSNGLVTYQGRDSKGT